MSYSKGDILTGRLKGRDEAYHPIIFWQEIEGSQDFIGLMITHSPNYNNIPNFLMNKIHFNMNRKIVFDKSYLVKAKFTKYNAWGPFRVKGNLTPAGVFFSENIVNDCVVQDFMDYKRHIDNE